MTRKLAVSLLVLTLPLFSGAQQPPPAPVASEEAADDTLGRAAERIEIAQTAPDRAIGARLHEILTITDATASSASRCVKVSSFSMELPGAWTIGAGLAIWREIRRE